ncbi:MAG: phosphatidate cytidylyltransferase [Pseudomonadota bacterium]
MLKQRVITAVLLLVVVLAALFANTSLYWQIFINIMILLGFWEWLRFCEISEISSQVLSFAAFIAVLVITQLGFVSVAQAAIAGCVLWVFLFVFTATDLLNALHHRMLKLLVGMALLSIGGLLVIELKNLENGPLWILCFMVCVWAADIGAYFVGRRFGKTKLAPTVSPGKTVEGLLGGVAFALLLYVPILMMYFSTTAALLLLLTVIITVLISVVGDLFESKMKRHVNLKDSSQILPGHGGVLDRIDSLLSGAPFFFSGLLALGYAA